MRRGVSLSDEEHGKIIAFHRAKRSRPRIAKKLKRSRAVVQNFLHFPGAYGSEKRTGRPSKLTSAGIGLLIREASKGLFGSDQLCQALQLSVQARRVRHIMHDYPTLRYKTF